MKKIIFFLTVFILFTAAQAQQSNIYESAFLVNLDNYASYHYGDYIIHIQRRPAYIYIYNADDDNKAMTLFPNIHVPNIHDENGYTSPRRAATLSLGTERIIVITSKNPDFNLKKLKKLFSQ